MPSRRQPEPVTWGHDTCRAAVLGAAPARHALGRASPCRASQARAHGAAAHRRGVRLERRRPGPGQPSQRCAAGGPAHPAGVGAQRTALRPRQGQRRAPQVRKPPTQDLPTQKLPQGRVCRRAAHCPRVCRTRGARSEAPLLGNGMRPSDVASPRMAAALLDGAADSSPRPSPAVGPLPAPWRGPTAPAQLSVDGDGAGPLQASPAGSPGAQDHRTFVLHGDGSVAGWVDALDDRGGPLPDAAAGASSSFDGAPPKPLKVKKKAKSSKGSKSSKVKPLSDAE